MKIQRKKIWKFQVDWKKELAATVAKQLYKWYKCRQLQVFSNSSSLGFDAAAYLQLEYSSAEAEVDSSMAMKHVKPFNKKTIPQPEPNGAYEGVDLLHLICAELHPKMQNAEKITEFHNRPEFLLRVPVTWLPGNPSRDPSCCQLRKMNTNDQCR